MKFNKWTVGLAAVGAVSLASAVRADEAKLNPLQTALSNTTISGYVSASVNWQIAPGGNESAGSPYSDIPFQAGKQDGFNLDVVKLSISKPEDESPWASGYQVDLLFGPDASGYNNSISSITGGTSANSEVAIKQAYVSLRTPVGNGIDWKIGVFDTPIGYEVFDSGSDPNYTRSIGYSVEPTEHTGILGTYRLSDEWSVSAGVANTLSAGINTRDDESGNVNNYWRKTALGSVTFTAPSSWGWAAGSSIYAGLVYGFGGGAGGTEYYEQGYQQNYYVGATLNTPFKQLTAGFAFDYVKNAGGGFKDAVPGFFTEYDSYNGYVLGAYATYKATDKLSLNGRAEYVHFDEHGNFFGYFDNTEDGYEFTATLEYDLWANVITRLEARWDHDNFYHIPGDHQDSLGLYANVIYKF